LGSTRRVGLSGTWSRGSPIPRFPEEAPSAHLPAQALRTGALPPLKAQSVRFPFGRPVPSSCRAPSFFRARVAPVAPSGSASHSHFYCALWLVHSLLDFESRFERIFTKLDIYVVIELRRSRGTRCRNCHVLFGASSFDGLSNLNKLAECAAESGLAALVRPLPGLSRKT
jgi:hypothetical protein